MSLRISNDDDDSFISPHRNFFQGGYLCYRSNNECSWSSDCREQLAETFNATLSSFVLFKFNPYIDKAAVSSVPIVRPLVER